MNVHYFPNAPRMSAMLFKLATESVQVSNGKRALAPVQNDRFVREQKLRDCLGKVNMLMVTMFVQNDMKRKLERKI